jgi:membrane protein DedA with SNARE-associated domain
MLHASKPLEVEPSDMVPLETEPLEMERTGRRAGRLWAGLLAGGAVLAAAGLYALLQTGFVVWLAGLNQWLADTVILRLGYWGVFALMFIESSLIPFPSEIVVPPAADLARRLPDWNVWAVIGVGTAGSLGGALFNYLLALYLGRPLLLRGIDAAGHYVRLSRRGYDQAEAFFLRHGAISTFTGRLIPGIRQIISLPAGLARMNLLTFCLLTSLGAGLWVAVLAWLGYWFGATAEQLATELRRFSHWLALAAAVLLGAYAWVQWRRRNARPQRTPDRPEADDGR